MSIVEEAKQIGMTELQVNAIMGSLMGDAAFRASGVATKAIHWNHGVCQKEYVQYKYQTLSEFATREPYQRPNPGFGDMWTVLHLRSLGVFHSMYCLMHPNNGSQKTITPEFLDEITHPIALAWWFMDDGSRRSGGNIGSIATNGFTLSENELLVDWLMSEWGIRTTIMQVINTTSGKPSQNLYIPTDGYLDLCTAIAEFAPECMQYKVTPVFKHCAVCGTLFAPVKGALGCSEDCRSQLRAQARQQYYEENKETILEKNATWAAEHRDQANAEHRAWYARLTPEQKQEQYEALLKWRKENRNHYLATRKAYREAHKDDPHYKALVAAQNARYYQKIMADPEKHERYLQMNREARKKPGRRAHELEYQRKYREEHPEIVKAQQERANAARRKKVATNEEYRLQRNVQAKAARDKKIAQMGKEAFLAVQREKYAQKPPEEKKKIADRIREYEARKRSEMGDEAYKQMKRDRYMKDPVKKALYYARIKANKERMIERMGGKEAYLEHRRELYRKRQEKKKASAQQSLQTSSTTP